MIHNGDFERLGRQNPASVMARAALEHALSSRAIDALFDKTADW